MKLFAVIHTVGGFAREDSPIASIAGIFTDEKIAELVKKAAGVGATIVTVNLDEVLPGYIDFAKHVLNIDLHQILQEKKFGLTEMDNLDKECLMTAQDFEEEAGWGGINSDDGSGYWATETKVSNVSCWSEKPAWATHVCWYNK